MSFLFATGGRRDFATRIGWQTGNGAVPKPNLPVSVSIGDYPYIQTISGEQLQYVGGAPGEVAGVTQINVRIPAGIPPGSAVPVSIRVGGISHVRRITIAVSGSECHNKSSIEGLVTPYLLSFLIQAGVPKLVS